MDGTPRTTTSRRTGRRSVGGANRVVCEPIRGGGGGAVDRRVTRLASNGAVARSDHQFRRGSIAACAPRRRFGRSAGERARRRIVGPGSRSHGVARGGGAPAQGSHQTLMCGQVGAESAQLPLDRQRCLTPGPAAGDLSPRRGSQPDPAHALATGESGSRTARRRRRGRTRTSLAASRGHRGDVRPVARRRRGRTRMGQAHDSRRWPRRNATLTSSRPRDRSHRERSQGAARDAERGGLRADRRLGRRSSTHSELNAGACLSGSHDAMHALRPRGCPHVPRDGDGACRARTGDLRLAKPTLSQLS